MAGVLLGHCWQGAEIRSRLPQGNPPPPWKGRNTPSRVWPKLAMAASPGAVKRRAVVLWKGKEGRRRVGGGGGEAEAWWEGEWRGGASVLQALRSPPPSTRPKPSAEQCPTECQRRCPALRAPRQPPQAEAGRRAAARRVPEAVPAPREPPPSRRLKAVARIRVRVAADVRLLPARLTAGDHGTGETRRVRGREGGRERQRETETEKEKEKERQ